MVMNLETSESEPVFASMSVVDVSSLIKVPKYKHQPSIASMVFLEKEIYDSIGDFEYSSEYINHFYESSTSDGFLNNLGADHYYLYTDILLGTQTWRRGLLDDINELNNYVNEMEENERLRYEYLLGKKIYTLEIMPMMEWGAPMAMEAMAFDMMFDEQGVNARP